MSNPILSEERWGRIADESRDASAMSVDGAVMKTGFLVLVLLGTIAAMWHAFWSPLGTVDGRMLPWMIGGGVGGFVLALVTVFAPRIAMFTGTLYAVAEGLLLGGVTMYFESQPAYHGLASIAACGTVATLVGMLALYKTGIIKATPGFIRGVFIATAGLAIGIGLLWLLSFFGIGAGLRAALGGSGPIGIGFSVVCIALAAFNLVVDFHVIEEGARRRAPKHMEWLAAFGLLVTLVWLYLEILRLLAKLRSR